MNILAIYVASMVFGLMVMLPLGYKVRLFGNADTTVAFVFCVIITPLGFIIVTLTIVSYVYRSLPEKCVSMANKVISQ